MRRTLATLGLLFLVAGCEKPEDQNKEQPIYKPYTQTQPARPERERKLTPQNERLYQQLDDMQSQIRRLRERTIPEQKD
jgi:hypothetical protein